MTTPLTIVRSIRDGPGTTAHCSLYSGYSLLIADEIDYLRPEPFLRAWKPDHPVLKTRVIAVAEESPGLSVMWWVNIICSSEVSCTFQVIWVIPEELMKRVSYAQFTATLCL